MKTFSALFFFGLFNLGFGRTMESATIQKRFREAKYAFKFRVISKSTKECFPGNNAVTMPQATTTTMTTSMPPTTAETEPQTTDTNPVPASTQRFTTLHTTEATETTMVSKPDTSNPTDRVATDSETTTDQTATKSTVLTSTNGTDLMSTTSVTETMTESLTDQNSFPSQAEESSQKPTTFAQNQREFKTTDTTSKGNSIKATTVSSVEQPKTTGNIQNGQVKHEFAFSTKSASPTHGMGDPTALENKMLANTTESMASRPARKKRSCEMLVYHQNIKILIKQMYKGCAEIRKMKRVKGMNKKFLKSTVRLQIGFSELRPNRNYFFMGRAVPGQDPSEYVFMADELTVVNWKSALKLRKKFKRNKECARKGR